MSGLAELNLHTSYRKGRDDIANDFYLPVMNVAVGYDRAVGFFRSSIFTIAWSALRGFVQRGGRIRILCSQVMAESDLDALDKGYSARINDVLAARLHVEVTRLLADATLAEPTRLLAALVAEGVVDLKVAVMRDIGGVANHRIFHDKVGIVRDDAGAVVVFKGSMNETWKGLAADGNLESVDVFCDWVDGRDAARVAEETEYFADLWANSYPGLDVRTFPDVARDALVAAASTDWESTLERLLEQALTDSTTATSLDPKGRSLRPHQAAGLTAWRAAGRRGILAFATGAGKTFTALDAIRESLTKLDEIPVIIVPDRLLFGQWHEEVAPLAKQVGAQVLRAGAGHDNWRDVLRDWTTPGAGRRLVLATVQTARSEYFRSRLAKGVGLLLIADEVHRLGSLSNRLLLDETVFGARLGLSATPERAGDSEGTSAIMDFFGAVLDPRYGLADAIREGVLTPYFYRPHPVTLTAAEAVEWDQITRRIVRLRAQLGDHTGEDDRLERLYFERARIVKQATAKIDLAVSVVREHYHDGERWLVYCDDMQQLEAVRDALGAAGYQAMPYHSAMESSREETLHWLDRYGGLVVAIRCLDEGVDIPSVTHALILASSKNPREFVQRRGRVLRKDEGKSLAFIHDAIVVPPRQRASLDDGPDPITAGDLARAIEFAKSAENPVADADLLSIAVDAGVDWEELKRAGVEDNDDE